MNKSLNKSSFKNFGTYGGEEKDYVFHYLEEEETIGDIEYFTYERKAFIEIARAHLPKGKVEPALKRFLTEMYSRTDKIILGVYVSIISGSGITDDDLQRVGFYKVSIGQYRSINPKFLELVDTHTNSEEDRIALRELYTAQLKRKKAYLENIVNSQKEDRESLSYFEQQGNDTMAKAKREDLELYDIILNLDTNKTI